jgi:hypothetical protein
MSDKNSTVDNDQEIKSSLFKIGPNKRTVHLQHFHRTDFQYIAGHSKYSFQRRNELLFTTAGALGFFACKYSASLNNAQP